MVCTLHGSRSRVFSKHHVVHFPSVTFCANHFTSGVLCGRVTIACSSTTQRLDCPCGTDPRSWLVELMLTSIFRSHHTREAWRMWRGQVCAVDFCEWLWMNCLFKGLKRRNENNLSSKILFVLFLSLYKVVNKEETEIVIATEENQDEEPTKAKKRK